MTPRRGLATALAALAWLVTMAQVFRTEVFGRSESADVRALVDSARLTRTHASATYVIRLGAASIGSLSSTVSGGQHEEQLAYVIDGRLTAPQDVRLKGVVLAGWDRRPQRVVLEATLGSSRHRLEGTLRPDAATGGSLFELRYVAPPGGSSREATWVLPEAPVLAPGPLPIPEFSGEPSSRRLGEDRGSLPDPLTGAPMPWTVSTGHVESVTIAGRVRQARRHDVRVGVYEGHAWTESSGFPLKLELPGSITIELVAEKR